MHEFTPRHIHPGDYPRENLPSDNHHGSDKVRTQEYGLVPVFKFCFKNVATIRGGYQWRGEGGGALAVRGPAPRRVLARTATGGYLREIFSKRVIISRGHLLESSSCYHNLTKQRSDVPTTHGRGGGAPQSRNLGGGRWQNN